MVGREEEVEKALGRLQEALAEGQSPYQEARKHGFFLRKITSERFMHRCHCWEF